MDSSCLRSVACLAKGELGTRGLKSLLLAGQACRCRLVLTMTCTLSTQPSRSAYFLGYNWAKDKSVKAGINPALAPMVAGLAADALAAPLFIPSEVVTSRLQIQGPGVMRYDSTWAVVRHIIATEGVRGLFTGLGAQIVAFGPASALWWASYEATANTLRDNQQIWRPSSGGEVATQANNSTRMKASAPAQANPTKDASESQLIPAISGLVAGLLTSVVTNPLDIAKTRLQTQQSILKEFEAHAVRQDKLHRNLAIEERKREDTARREGYFKRTVSNVARTRVDAARARDVAQKLAALMVGEVAVTAARQPTPPVSGDAAAASSFKPASAAPSQMLRQLQQVLAKPLTLREAFRSSGVQAAFDSAASSAFDSLQAAVQGSLATAKLRAGAASKMLGALSASAGSAAAVQAPTSTAVAAAPAERAGFIQAPSLGVAPFQSSIARNPSLVKDAKDAERIRLADAEASRLGRRRLHSPQGARTASLSPGRRSRQEGTQYNEKQEERGRKRGYHVRFAPQPLPAAAAASVAATAPSASVPDASSASTRRSYSVRLVRPSELAGRRGTTASSAQPIGAAANAQSTLSAKAGQPPRPIRAAGALSWSQARTFFMGPAQGAPSYPAASLRSAGLSRHHDNMYRMLVSIYRNEGALALTRGIVPRMVVNGPASAATFVLYEQVLRLSRKPVEAGGGVTGQDAAGVSMIAKA